MHVGSAKWLATSRAELARQCDSASPAQDVGELVFEAQDHENTDNVIFLTR